MSTAKETRLNIRISPEELAELKAFAESRDMSLSEFVLTASRAYTGKAQKLEERLLDVERQIAYLKNKVA